MSALGQWALGAVFAALLVVPMFGALGLVGGLTMLAIALGPIALLLGAVVLGQAIADRRQRTD